MRRSVPGRALAALALLTILVPPSIASAQQRQVPERRASSEHAVQVGLLARLSTLWTHLWGQARSILDPNGRTLAGTPGGHGTSPASEEGLDPDGK
jgi:hypothetical protein